MRRSPRTTAWMRPSRWSPTALRSFASGEWLAPRSRVDSLRLFSLMGMRAGEAGEVSVRGTSEDRPLNEIGADVERDTQVPEVQPAAEARAGDGQLARRALDRRALPRARHQRKPVAALARAGAGGRDGTLRRR